MTASFGQLDHLQVIHTVPITWEEIIIIRYYQKKWDLIFHIIIIIYKIVGYDGSVGIETRYGLDCPPIESRWGARFSAPVQIGPGAHPTSYTRDIGSFLRLKPPGRGVDQPPPTSAQVTSSGTSRLVSRVKFTFILIYKIMLRNKS